MPQCDVNYKKALPVLGNLVFKQVRVVLHLQEYSQLNIKHDKWAAGVAVGNDSFVTVARPSDKLQPLYRRADGILSLPSESRKWSATGTCERWRAISPRLTRRESSCLSWERRSNASQ